MTQTFPSNLPGLTFDSIKRPVFDTRVLTARSGKEQRVATRPFPRWEFELSYDFLRDNVNTEYQTLLGFVLQAMGEFANFYYVDPVDNSITLQTIGVGDGTTKNFQIVRTFGGFVDIVKCVTTNGGVYVDGVLKTSGVDYLLTTSTGGYGPDTIAFTTAPVSTKVITMTFNFAFVCRFLNDKYDFKYLWSNFYDLQKIDFTSVL